MSVSYGKILRIETCIYLNNLPLTIGNVFYLLQSPDPSREGRARDSGPKSRSGTHSVCVILQIVLNNNQKL